MLRKWLLKEKNTIKETLLWSALEQLELCPGTSPIRSSILWRWKLICKERASAENVTKRAPLWENSWVGCFFKDHHIEATPVWGGRLHFQLAAEPGSTVYMVLILQARMTQGWGIREVCAKVPEATEARQRTATSESLQRSTKNSLWKWSASRRGKPWVMEMPGPQDVSWEKLQAWRTGPRERVYEFQEAELDEWSHWRSLETWFLPCRVSVLLWPIFSLVCLYSSMPLYIGSISLIFDCTVVHSSKTALNLKRNFKLWKLLKVNECILHYGMAMNLVGME